MPCGGGGGKCHPGVQLNERPHPGEGICQGEEPNSALPSVCGLQALPRCRMLSCYAELLMGWRSFVAEPNPAALELERVRHSFLGELE